MIRTLSLLFGLVCVVSGNPAAGKPWKWISPKPLVDANGVATYPRIVGGNEAQPHSWPHQVALFIDDMYFCGGSLISNISVLTAAHCMDGAVFVDVVMGAHNVQLNEPTQVTMRSTDFTTHRQWNSQTLHNDISLIRLPSPVTFTAEIAAVNLPTSDPADGTIVTPTGWGKTSDSTSSISDVLREVDVPIMPNPDCDAVYGGITATQICIDSIGGKGTCNGDSGGPLNYNGVTLGITSFGAAAGCQAGFPDAFTRVTAYLDWIASNT